MNQTVQIDDPLHNGNNVGKSSFKFFEIKVRRQGCDHKGIV